VESSLVNTLLCSEVCFICVKTKWQDKKWLVVNYSYLSKVIYVGLISIICSQKLWYSMLLLEWNTHNNCFCFLLCHNITAVKLVKDYSNSGTSHSLIIFILNGTQMKHWHFSTVLFIYQVHQHYLNRYDSYKWWIMQMHCFSNFNCSVERLF